MFPIAGVTDYHKITGLGQYQVTILWYGSQRWMNPTGLNQDAGRAVFLSFLKGMKGKNSSREVFFFLPFPTCKGYPSPPIPWIIALSSKLAMAGLDNLTLCHFNTLSSASLFHLRGSLWHLVHPDHPRWSLHLKARWLATLIPPTISNLPLHAIDISMGSRIRVWTPLGAGHYFSYPKEGSRDSRLTTHSCHVKKLKHSWF